MWHNIFQVLKENNYQPQISYQEKQPLKNEGEIKISSNEEKLKDLSLTDISLGSSLNRKK